MPAINDFIHFRVTTIVRRDLLMALGLVSILGSGIVSAEGADSDQAVLERIRPVGQVNVAHAAKAPAPAAAAPAAESPVQTAAGMVKEAVSAAAGAVREAAGQVMQAMAPQQTAPAGGDDPAALAQAKGCLGCHQVNMKVVGPAYKDVAAKYAGDAGALDRLVAKVKSGGAGNWGQIPMPPQAVTDEEAATLVRWVLSR